MMDVRVAILVAMLGALLSGHSCGDDTSLVARWDFGEEELTSISTHGAVERDQPGPIPPEFPDFAENNTAVRLDGNGAYLSIEDPGLESAFDFADGDAITLEAWVKVDEIRDGQQMYVIGKGRTNAPHFAHDNQNWALRVVGADGAAHLSFLFATAPEGGSSHWHRWTSKSGFHVVTGWHHVAVAYQFGEPESMRGWVDGQPTTGDWDMGGPTKKPPVVDNDAVWIGSSMAGNPANSFRGWLDAIAVHRKLLDDASVATRFRRLGGPRIVGPLPETMPQIDNLPPGRVLVTFHEALPSHERWLNEGESWPDETCRWEGDAFVLPRIPLRYDDWGIRSGWKAPLLVRMAADVELPPGNQRFLLRTRGLSRLWVDGTLVARTEPANQQPPNGEEPITPLAVPPRPGLRAAGYHQQEVSGEVSIAGTEDGLSRACRVVLEMVVGGKNQRTETGEVSVAVETDDGRSFAVLQPGSHKGLPLTDEAIGAAMTRIEASLSRFDDQTRRQAASSQDDFWDRRHDIAREWASQHPMTALEPIVSDAPQHFIDAFLAAKIDQALAAAAASDAGQAESFHGTVLPILREHCFRCHGEKDKGGLKLNSRERALRGGDSEVPAVAAGQPEASEMMLRIRSKDENLRMPPTGPGLTDDEITVLERWIHEGAIWPAPPVDATDVAVAPIIGDEAFLRRVSLDTIGLSPSLPEAEAFLTDHSPDKRERLIDRLLQDERFADHAISDWQDLLAENPTLLNASLNSTGPFRWFLYDSLRDNKPIDRMVTELLMMRGGAYEGGSAGFAMAAENDAPLAAKGHIVASAFLGVELQCARCHDSPYHSTTQRDLYSLAAMLARKPVTVPETSRVPDAFFESNARDSLIRVSLGVDEVIAPTWPFEEATGVSDNREIDRLMLDPKDSRERLAALITAPQNMRFSQVVVNRVWKRLMGAGLVEPAHDWEGQTASHPELLDWLARQLITHDYDLRHIARLILTSQAYQREATGRNQDAAAKKRYFNAPDRRRLTAEQIVDSLHQATGRSFDVEELTFVHDGRRPLSNRQTLGRPVRAWMFASLNNERDRPSLSLPRARAVADVLEAFGWTGSRQKPITERDVDPNVLQPGILANGILTMSLTRVAQGSDLARLAVDATSPEELVDAMFLRILCRKPKTEERAEFSRALSEGFETRVLPPGEVDPPPVLPALPLVTWFNHLQADANTIQQEVERRVRLGPAPDPRLRTEWREIFEDFTWSLVNDREFVWVP